MRLAGRSIAYVSTNHGWSRGWTFYQVLAERLAQENDVVYVDPPRSALRLGMGDLSLLARPRGVDVGPRLRVFESASLPLQRTERRQTAAARLLAAQLGRWAHGVGFVPDLVWCYAPMERPLARRFPEATLVYWTGDEVVLPGEPELLEAADAILCVSEPVFERHRRRYGEKVQFVPVACDFDRYHAAAADPHELNRLERPIYGYSGFVNQRVDVRLLTELATRIERGTVAVVGPVGAEVRADVERLAACPRAVLLGAQPADRVPRLLASFDVGLIPYVDSVFNRGSNPVKFYEYLAAGLPVVTTAIPTLRHFGDVASVGDAHSFVDRALAAAVEPVGSVDARVAVAREHSFEALLRRLEDVHA